MASSFFFFAGVGQETPCEGYGFVDDANADAEAPDSCATKKEGYEAVNRRVTKVLESKVLKKK